MKLLAYYDSADDLFSNHMMVHIVLSASETYVELP